ncbi:MAG: AEC family transporter [Methyloprofundus sp.]|nr:AEC family transporter [Methyloprofundus sp.]
MNEQFFYALNVTTPVLSLLLLGLLFRRLNLIDDGFIQTANRLVFNITLPCMLFFGIASTPLSQSNNLPLFIFGASFTLFCTALFYLFSIAFVQADKRGTFVQGAFRGNLGIIGIALAVNAYGTEVLAVASLYMAIISLIDNPLSVLLLKPKGHPSLKSIFTNPIIIAVSLGLIFSGLQLTIPAFTQQSGQYLAQLTLPLALICIGGSLNWQSFHRNHLDVILATAFKLLLMPIIGLSIAYQFNFSADELGLLYLMLSAPTAVSSYIMAKQMTRHGAMAAEIIALTTAMSTFVITAGLVLLKSMQII